MKLQFLGAATTVTGSQFLLTTDQAKILIDCGMFQGSPNESIRNRIPLAYDPAQLDAILLTHAHLDHCGRLPLLKKMGYPVPNSITVKDLSELKHLAKKIKFPVVIKPLGAAGGKGVTIDIRNNKVLLSSFLAAKQYGKKVLIEQHLTGDYYRLTYIADGTCAATKNMPAFITGDGKKTAQQLIAAENKQIERAKRGRLNKIKITEKTKRFLASDGYTLSSVLPKGKRIPLCFSGYDGGEYIDVTSQLHSYFKKLGKEVVENLGLPIVGIDIITTDISRPLTKTGGAIIEINGKYPDIQFHNVPTQGKSRNLAPNIINYLFRKI